MRHRFTAAAAAATLLVGCQGGTGGGDAALDTEDQKASYAIGLEFGNQLSVAGDRIDLAALTAGIEDARAEAEARIPAEERQAIMQAFSQSLQAEARAQAEADATENAEEGAAYLAENAGRDEVTTTESGLQYEVLREGDGERPTAEDRVTVHYRGTLVDGTEFDASYGGDPATFAVNGVIPGFSEALQLMPVGSHYRVVIPGEIAYGSQGSGPLIGPNETLIFEIELLEIVE